jgi:DivIVA domain-containing protein
MGNFDRPEATLDEPVKPRTTSSRFADLGDRLARTFGGFDQSNAKRANWVSNGAAHDQGPQPTALVEDPAVAHTTGAEHPPVPDPPAAGDPGMAAPLPAWEPVQDRFPTVRRGYDRAAVDEHIAELERELEELRDRAPRAVAVEIERIGEQTAAILSTAHEQAQETTRRAQTQADECIANAASNAVAITQGASQQLRELDGETDAVWRERARLIDDVRTVATALLALAQDAADRFPAEPEKTGTLASAHAEVDGGDTIEAEPPGPEAL